MTELKEMLEKLWANSDVVTIESIIDFMNDYGIEKEKEQIIEAYEDGKQNGMDSITNIHMYIIGEMYYNQTYNQNK